ncbi:MAG: DNA repair ATPase [Cellvibrionaceae bacterium]|nr:DNA repair ATPase [Cellvibrionaceae bacterium]
MADTASEPPSSIDSAVAEGGAYDVLRRRLNEQGQALNEQVKNINSARLAEFGQSDLKIATRTRVRTANNCVARDIVQVGELLLFSYNVFIGLKKATQINDVFAVFKLQHSGDQYELLSVDIDTSFLNDSRFQKDFNELYHYYKKTHLKETRVVNGLLLMGFQISEREEDIRVFRWSLSADGTVLKYIDNRGERDLVLPPSFDFDWQEATREDTVQGRYPHVNILDTLFVETINGDLTIKIEDNTEDGQGIYREAVEDGNQSIDDAAFCYARLGGLILLKVLPYKEKHYRHFVYNTLTEQVLRLDAIASSCVQLPEDHGIIFPGGYFLQDGEHKDFAGDVAGMRFQRKIRSPNGEDFLYVFYEPISGTSVLLAYNLIEKRLQNPLYCHGYALGDDGKIVMFVAEEEATRVHPMQIWQTPFVGDDYASQQPKSQSFFSRIGNASLVRGISDVFSICRSVNNQSVTLKVYEELAGQSKKIFDNHYWIDSDECHGIANLIRSIAETAELTIDEFQKVQSIQQQSNQALEKAKQQQQALLLEIRNSAWQQALDYVNALGDLKKLRGHLASIRQLRYIDVAQIALLESELLQSQEDLNTRTAEFLSQDKAFEPYQETIANLDKAVEKADSNISLSPLLEQMDQLAEGLDMLTDMMSTLQVADVNVRTQIIDATTSVYAKLNQSRALAKHKQKNLGSKEATAQFAAQFKLFSQSVTNALGLAATPEECDKQMSRLLVQLEDLESQFGEFEQFLGDIISKREEVYESFEAHKQQLLDAQQRKAQNIFDAAERALASIERRVNKFKDMDALNTYLGSDALVLKINDFVEQLRQLNASVQAEDVSSRLKGIKDQGLRLLRDKAEIYEGEGNVIKLGPRHKFSVNTQSLDLTIIPRQQDLYLHLTGTDFFETINDSPLSQLSAYWDVAHESESPFFCRAEFLAASVMQQAQTAPQQPLMDLLKSENALLERVRDYAAPRYKEGYTKGIHDHDAAKILSQLIPALAQAGHLKYDPLCRGLAQVFWANIEKIASQLASLRLSYSTWPERAQSAARLANLLSSLEAKQQLATEIEVALTEFVKHHPIVATPLVLKRSAAYLVDELGSETIRFVCSKHGMELAEALKRTLDQDSWRHFQVALERMLGWPAERWQLSESWFKALVENKSLAHLQHYIPEAVAIVNTENRLERELSQAELELHIDGLLSEHSRIENRCLALSIDDFLTRYSDHCGEFIPEYHRYQALRKQTIQEKREQLRLEELKPRPLSSFVRNRLINESYLPIIGDNLAKQMGTIGDNKRSDLMGLLMMISPPGYGKTTLMEYVADRLGLIFMKINCPSLGHDVLSLDPSQAPNATAQQELKKLNLALEMGNNVMLYLDDIQHTDPEFLQKFISLCDGTRRIEGVWQGQSRTYDMRGKKFCVVMAGNPYTESGELFKVPDMLANRADIYNLGDILGGMDEQFALSYIENSLTSNPVLAPLATRDMQDTYLLIAMAEGKEVASSDLKHQYSAAEVKEICDVLKKLFVIRDIVLKINQQYIESAAQDEQNRVEPPFKLQGSYRNMNKMAEKVAAVLNAAELQQLIDDHYRGESQLLTQGSEENLLKLAELRGTLSHAQQQRWQDIKQRFVRNQKLGGKNSDAASQVVAQLGDIAGVLTALQHNMQAGVENALHTPQPAAKSDTDSVILGALDKIQGSISASLAKVQVVNQPVPGMDKVLRVLANTLEQSIFPLMKNMDKKFEIDLSTHNKISDLFQQLKNLEMQIKMENAESTVSVRENVVKNKP